MPPDPIPASPENPLRRVHTKSLPDLLRRLGVSLVVSTYQAGKMILIRADGDVLNTHFVNFDKPMGITADGSRLTIGGHNLTPAIGADGTLYVGASDPDVSGDAGLYAFWVEVP